MLITISPAKTLDLEPQSLTKKHSTPQFLDAAERLIAKLRKLSPSRIGKLMGVSDKLAGEVAEYVRAWQRPFDESNAKQALLMFKGDLYEGIGAGDFKARDFDFAQRHLRILSGLYGVLRPLDWMQPYRLEMGSPLKEKTGRQAERFSSLYEFWGERITAALNETLADQHDAVLVNLASNEYFKSVRRDMLNATVITPVFMDEKNGKFKVLSFFAKKARGRMVRYIIRNRLKNSADIKSFDLDGYRYNGELSSELEWVFTRGEK
jgi:cytoplasmic iron level regulating protein YaaA (DUF328/UPF0246 family)